MNDKQKLSFIGNRKWAVLTVLFFYVLVHSTAFTQEMQVKIGVLAKRGNEICLKRWGPTAKYLSAKIPGKTFVIVPIDFEQIYSFVEYGKVDFILANSSFYVELEHWYGANRIATLKNLRLESVYTEFAGVIFWKASRGDLRELTDIKGKTFMAVKETSFGGWRMAWREFKAIGIDPYRDFKALRFGGTHDAVVYAVRDGKVDAGTIRTDTFERMQAEGKIDIKDFYVIHKDSGKSESLPFLHSTCAYPEWPMAKVRHTPDSLAEKVAVALLEMPPNSDAAKAGQCAGWTIPMNYQSVHECLKELKVGPYKDLGKITLANLIQQYWHWILLGFIGIIVLVTVTIYVIRLNRKLNISTIELKKSRNILEQKVEERTSELRQSNQQLIKENKDRRQAEKALQLEHDNFKNILGSMEDGVYIVNMEYEIQYINLAIKKEFGPANGHKCYEYLHGRTEVCPWCKISDVLAGKTVRWEWYSSKNQKIYDLIDTPFRNPDGSISKLEIFRDITERKRIESKLKQNENMLRQIIDTSPNSIFLKDRNGMYLMVNKIMAELHNKKPADFVGKYDYEIAKKWFEAIDYNEFRKDELVVIDNKKTLFINEEPFVYHDGTERWFQTTKIPFELEDNQNCLLVISTEITEHKQAEEELKKHREHLEELVKERTKEIEAFSYSVSHDLRAPLRAIDGFTSILMDDYVAKLDAEGKRLGGIIQNNANKMGKLIDDLLSFSRMGRAAMTSTKIDMKNMVNAMYHEMTSAKERKRITFNIAKLSKAEGDTNMMRQVWMNLISNAVKFSSYRKQAVISVTCQEEEDKLTYCIKDNGVGFNMKYKDKLFGVFQRLHSEKEFEGTGVGLALVQRIILRHGGDVWAEGKVDKGATFYFSLPKKGGHKNGT